MSIIFSSLEGAKRRSIFVIVVVILSLLAGMVGSFFASSFDFALFGLGTVNEVTPDYNAKANVIIREAKNVVVTQNEQVQQIASGYVENSLIIVKKSSKLVNPGDKYYSMTRPFAEAMPVTSDGWLISNLRGKFKKEIFKASDFLVLNKNKTQFEIDKVIKDEKSGLYFLHIKSNDLIVYKNSNPSQLRGAAVVLANHEGMVTTSNVVGVTGSNSIDFSDAINVQYLFDQKFEVSYSALLSLAGDLVGYINQDGQVVSSREILASTNSIIKFGAIKRPSLGVYCQNSTTLVPVDGKKIPTDGCLVFNNNESPVVPGSQAEKSGLKPGDLIVSINQKPASDGLSGIISQYLPGDKITLSILRTATPQNLEITLSEKK